MPLRAVLFDLDNTLMDFWRMKRKAVKAAVDAMRDAGLPLSREEALKQIYALYEKRGAEYQLIFDEFLSQNSSVVDPKLLGAAITAYRQVKDSFLEPYPQVVPVLIELIRRGYKLGIVTNAPRLQAWTRLSGMRLQHFFDIVVTPDDAGGVKPDSKPFTVAAQALKLSPTEIAMVGDSYDFDVAGAKSAGLVSIYAAYGQGWKEEETVEPDHSIDDITELLRLCPPLR